MKKRPLLLLALLASAAGAQPPPIDDPLMLSLNGEWEGGWERPSGSHPTAMKRTLGPGGQFIVVEAVLGFPSPYRGMGLWTVDPATGEWSGHWFDNYRQVHTGRGRVEEGKLVMEWSTWGGHTRIIEKVGDDGMTLTVLRPCASNPAACGGAASGTFQEKGTYTRKR